MRLAVLALAGCTVTPLPDPDGRSLATMAEARDRRFATFLFDADFPDPAFQAALHEHDEWIVPVFQRVTEPARDVYDFSLADAVVDAAPPTTAIYVPGLITNDLIADWLAPVPPEQRATVMVDFISNVITHFETKYPGRVTAYEVVLEPLSWPDRSGFWASIGTDGRDYIRLAYRTARAAAPNAKLYIQDFGVEGSGDKPDRYVELVSSLRAEGVPIDGVGLEGHFMIGDGGAFPPAPPSEALVANLERFADLGVETSVASVDIAIRDDELSDATLAEQADAYQRTFHACLVVPSCRAIGTWGVDDRDSWIPQAFPAWGSPLLFDAHYAHKPAYDAVWRELATPDFSAR